jgi:hypothetical protein
MLILQQNNKECDWLLTNFHRGEMPTLFFNNKMNHIDADILTVYSLTNSVPSVPTKVEVS